MNNDGKDQYFYMLGTDRLIGYTYNKNEANAFIKQYKDRKEKIVKVKVSTKELDPSEKIFDYELIPITDNVLIPLKCEEIMYQSFDQFQLELIAVASGWNAIFNILRFEDEKEKELIRFTLTPLMELINLIKMDGYVPLSDDPYCNDVFDFEKVVYWYATHCIL